MSVICQLDLEILLDFLRDMTSKKGHEKYSLYKNHSYNHQFNLSCITLKPFLKISLRFHEVFPNAFVTMYRLKDIEIGPTVLNLL